MLCVLYFCTIMCLYCTVCIPLSLVIQKMKENNWFILLVPLQLVGPEVTGVVVRWGVRDILRQRVRE